jgi:hypothetical protein
MHHFGVARKRGRHIRASAVAFSLFGAFAPDRGAGAYHARRAGAPRATARGRRLQPQIAGYNPRSRIWSLASRLAACAADVGAAPASAAILISWRTLARSASSRATFDAMMPR